MDGELMKVGEPGVTPVERHLFLQQVGGRVEGSEPLPGSLLGSI